MTIFVTMTRLVVMANMMKMAIIAAGEYYEWASNMAIMGIFLKKNKKAERVCKLNLWLNSYSQHKKYLRFFLISVVVWVNISSGLRDPLGYSDSSTNVFGSSLIVS